MRGGVSVIETGTTGSRIIIAQFSKCDHNLWNSPPERDTDGSHLNIPKISIYCTHPPYRFFQLKKITASQNTEYLFHNMHVGFNRENAEF
jgi:hypothetical protein